MAQFKMIIMSTTLYLTVQNVPVCFLFIFVFLYFLLLSGFMLISANYLLAVAVYLVYKHQALLVFSFKSLQESTKTHSHHVKLLLWCFYQ